MLSASAAAKAWNSCASLYDVKDMLAPLSLLYKPDLTSGCEQHTPYYLRETVF